MKRARIVAPGSVEVGEGAELAVQPGTAVVRPLVIAIDGSDTRRVYDGAPDSYPLAPSTCAHQIVGRVEAIEYVGVKPLPFVVDEVAIVRRPGFDGLAEQILVPIDDLIHQTLDTPLHRLALVHQLARALMAADRLRDVVGRSVAVVGQGPAGLVLDAVLRRAGARQVIGIDPIATRREAALRFGATAAVDPAGGTADAAARVAAISGAHLPDVVVEAAGSADSINLAVALVRAEGRLLLYGEPRAPTFPFDYGVLYEKQCEVVMSTPATYEADGYHAYRLATNHLARGDFDFDGLITHRLPIDRRHARVRTVALRGRRRLPGGDRARLVMDPTSASIPPSGVHDRGGLPTGELIDRSTHELADWEHLTNALIGVLRHRGLFTVDELRRGIESLPPDRYESYSYYERWSSSLETVLVEKGVLTREEIDARVKAVGRRWE